MKAAACLPECALLGNNHGTSVRVTINSSSSSSSSRRHGAIVAFLYHFTQLSLATGDKCG